MFAVIFEVNPRPDAWDDYLAPRRQPCGRSLQAIEGFMANRALRQPQPPRLAGIAVDLAR